MQWLRSLIFMIYFYLICLITVVVMLPLFALPRRLVMRGLHVWSAAMILGLRLICGVRVEVRGLEHKPTGPALIAAKHQSGFDVFSQFSILPDVGFVMKKELLNVPLFGWYGLKAGMVVVDRDGHSAALKKLVRDAKELLRRDRQLIIFPEGTRKNPGEAPDYKPGVAALYRELDLPCTLMALNTGAHWPAKGLLRKPGVIVFEYLPAIPAGLKRGEFMRELETRLEAATAALLAEGV